MNCMAIFAKPINARLVNDLTHPDFMFFCVQRNDRSATVKQSAISIQ
jgi:hypothetical protein